MPLLNKNETRKLKPPIFPYCLSTIDRLCFVQEKDCEPEYRYMYCPECNALLAILPVTKGEMDIETINAIIGRNP